MLRFLGGILILSATTGAGFLYGAELQNYLEKLLYIRSMIYMIQGELDYTGAPLGEVFQAVSQRVKEPYKSWLHSLERKIKKRESDAFMKIWMQSIDHNLAELNLKKEHLFQLKELGICLGQTDAASQNRTLALYLNRLELEIEHVRDGIASKKRIGKCFGVLGGMFLLVILM